MKIILSHPTGNANVRAVADKLEEQNKLFKFYTSIAIFPGSFWLKLSSLSFLKELKRRVFIASLEKYTKSAPMYEIGRIISSKLNVKKCTTPETGVFCVENIYKKLDVLVAHDLKKAKAMGATAVYAYEDGALETFVKAKALGLLCIYDLPIAYWEKGRELMQQEAERLPAWAITLGGGITDSATKLERKRKELELADVVIGPGSFVLDSLPSWSKDKIKIMSPFGSPKSGQEFKITNKNKNQPLRVLFVGSMGQRKGLGDLFEAIALLDKNTVELVVLGSLLAPMSFYQSQLATFTHEAGRSNDEVLALMRTCDLFCLPSIVEGRALVMQEAMSQGLPIIITPNTGGEDLVLEGETGFLVPIRSPRAIADKIKWFADNKDQIQLMGEKARSHSQKYTWDNYSATILNQLAAIYE